MEQETGSRRRRTRLWNHVFYFAASGGTSLLIYRISGGFPPSTWVNFWSVVSQIHRLWATSGFALFFLIIVLGLQSLLLLLVWVASLGFLTYEVVMILDAFSLWQTLSFFRSWSDALGTRVRLPLSGKLAFARTGQHPVALAAGQTVSPMALPAPSSQAEPGLSVQNSADTASFPTPLEVSPPERSDLLSNTMSPALPESMRWILRSPEFIAQSMQKTLAEHTPTLTGNGAEKDLRLNPFVEEALSYASLDNQEPKPAEESLANPFENEKPEENPLANPFESDPALSVLSSKSEKARPAEDPLANPFKEEEEQDDTLPSMPTADQEPKLAKVSLVPLVEGQKEAPTGEGSENRKPQYS